MEQDLKTINAWLKYSDLKVNVNKTELCILHKKDTTNVKINIGETTVTSGNFMNVLGVALDSKLKWGKYVSRVISRANGALNALKLWSCPITESVT